jgi:hypothetical protein
VRRGAEPEGAIDLLKVQAVGMALEECPEVGRDLGKDGGHVLAAIRSLQQGRIATIPLPGGPGDATPIRFGVT